MILLAFFDKDISEQLFAEFSAKQEQISGSTGLLVWLDAFRSVEGQWDSDLFQETLIRLGDSSLLQAFVRGLDRFYHASLHPLTKYWIHLRTDISPSQENTCIAGMLVANILQNSCQAQHFNLSLLIKQNITSHIIALEESYQEFFISQSYIPSNQEIFDECKTSQIWFVKFFSEIGLYHHSEIIC